MSGGNDAGSLSVDDGDGKSNCIASLIRRDQYELPDFPTKYHHAFFFVIKSYSEDDKSMVHIRKQRKGWQIEGANVRSFFSFHYV